MRLHKIAASKILLNQVFLHQIRQINFFIIIWLLLLFLFLSSLLFCDYRSLYFICIVPSIVSLSFSLFYPYLPSILFISFPLFYPYYSLYSYRPFYLIRIVPSNLSLSSPLFYFNLQLYFIPKVPSIYPYVFFILSLRPLLVPFKTIIR